MDIDTLRTIYPGRSDALLTRIAELYADAEPLRAAIAELPERRQTIPSASLTTILQQIASGLPEPAADA